MQVTNTQKAVPIKQTKSTEGIFTVHAWSDDLGIPYQKKIEVQGYGMRSIAVRFAEDADYKQKVQAAKARKKVAIYIESSKGTILCFEIFCRIAPKYSLANTTGTVVYRKD